MGSRGVISPTGSKRLKNNKANDKIEAEIHEAMVNTNPHFGEGRQWEENCQRCVYAYEMNRRGEKCEAKPRILNDKDILDSQWDIVMQNQKWDKVGASQEKTVVRKIEKKMKKYGKGSRAIIYLQWKQGLSHVFNVENVNGKIKYIEAQKGIEIHINDYVSASKTSSVMISRVDNLSPKGYILDNIIERK